MSAPERIWAFSAVGDDWRAGQWRLFDGKQMFGYTPEYLRADTAIPLTAPALVEVREALYSCLGALKAAGVQFWPEEEARAALAKLDALMKQQGGA
jgi:hypothetical protein